MHVTFSSVFSSRYSKTRTYKFRKIVRRHTEGVVGNLLGFAEVKIFENPLKIDKGIAKSLVYYFFGHSVLYIVFP